MEDKETRQILENIADELRQRKDLSDMDDDFLLAQVEKEVLAHPILSFGKMNEKALWIDQVYAEIRGYGVLDYYLENPKITEIMVNAYNEIFYEEKGRIFKGDRVFPSKKRLIDIIQKIVSDSGKEVNQRKPICDCRMKDGSRVNVVLEPITARSPVLTIRRFSDSFYDLEDLVSNRTLSREAADFLDACIKAKSNIFISGSTGSGKTTLLNALAGQIPEDERLITIEDARELNFGLRENWLALEARAPTVKGQGGVDIRDLIRASLRMRPDRIIVGEVRGKEAIDMLQAMNTGHDGSLSTGHANSIEDMQFRLETMVIGGHEGLPLQAIRQQIGAAIEIFVHLSRMPDHSRKLVEIKELVAEDGKLTYHSLFHKSWKDPMDQPAQWTGAHLTRKDKFLREGVASPLLG
ncbi:CpaF family protein [Kallipyga massiliensis]|uniref:CpaF family protein n=1 Tax=Kallipyga massiliensis TaxID=1472764 RepID=UPI0004B4F8AA|nr:ATPase, T2SS/T4P/T4SS family [Kallipyga massiliensis]